MLDRKAEDAAHVQALGARRGDPRDQFRRYGTATTLRPAVEDRLHFRGVPGHDYIGEQAQGIGDGLHFILALGLIVGDTAGVDQALQGIGARGGVARIYRILADERRRLTPIERPGSVEALQRELATMPERAERAEAREEAHQTHWAGEIDRLRMKLQALEPQAMQGRRDREGTELLRYQLRAAEQRASELEEQLIASTAPSGPDVPVPHASEGLARYGLKTDL